MFENREFEIIDESTGKFRSRMHIPDEPPELDYFNNWINQSFHLSCKKFYEKIVWKNIVANKFEASYLSESSFVFSLLSKIFPAENRIDTNTANILLNMELPFLEQINISDLMEVRMNDGGEFQSFRLYLEKQLKDLRLIKDPEELKVKAENAMHDCEIKIHAVEQKMKHIKRKSTIMDVVILTGSLMSVIQTGEMSIPALAALTARGIKPIIDGSSQVKQNPAYFLWKVLDKSS
ncbi:MAG: hypothetical protein AAFQ80_15045 [Cyanobacteria bacterium J06621_8]